MKTLLTICVLVSLMFAIVSPAGAAVLEVRPPGGVGTLADVYTSIQQAIDEASPGDTINVAAGTYEDNTVGPDGHLIINKANLTLKSSAGKDSTTINVANGVGIDIQAGASGFVLGGAAGNGFTIAGGTDTSFVIQLVNGPSGVEISHNGIDSTGNASMGVSVGVAGAADLTISDNDFTADSSDGSIWAPRVVDFTVSDNTFDGGAYAIQTNGVTANSQSLISGNEITNATGSGGIVIGNGEGTSDLAITGNTITGCVHGIYLAQYCAQGTPGDMTTVTIEDNTLSANDKGILITDGAHVLASNFTMQDNCITGNTTYGLQNQHASEVVNAELNAWGDADGPYHPGTNPYTSGDQVSDNVDYYQWYPDCNFTTPVYKPVHNVTLDRYYDTIQDAIDDAGDGDTITAGVQTYNESVTIDLDNLTLSGIEGSLPSITGGVTLAGVSGLTLENFVIAGDGGTNSVIRMTGAVTDLTLDNCVLDGENVSGRMGLTGGQLEGDVTITNCELKNLLGWAVLDSRSGSGGDGSAMDTVIFADNNIHHCNGSIVFRGLSTDRTDVVNAYGNTWNSIGGNNAEQGDQWAALEINRTVQANIYDNDVNGVSEGAGGEGQALQLWDIDTLDVHDNTFTDNFQGIQVYGKAFGDTFAVPGGSVYCNAISGNSDFGINVDPCATGGPLDAELNWWGDATGPNGLGGGSGDAVSANVDFFPWLLSTDCGDFTVVVADYVVDDDWEGLPNWYTVTVGGTDYYIGLNAFAVIQDAIDAASDGNSISVMVGTYNENINVYKRVEITGQGSDTGGTVVTQSAAGAGDTKIGVVQLNASGLSETQPLLLKDLRVEPDGMAGFSVGRFCEATGTSVSYVELDNVQVIGNNTNPGTEQERGLYVDLTSTLSHLAVVNCAFDNLTYGWYLQKDVSADTSTVEYVTVSGTSFTHNNLKGIYAEKLSDATFKGCVVAENGFSDSGVPPSFLPWMCGVDINLKAGTYGNLSFIGCTVVDNALGGAQEGVGLTVKGRGTGSNPSSSYVAYPAYVDNVDIIGGEFAGNERGIRFGEPGKGNATPTHVTVSAANIYDNVQTYSGTDGSAYGGLVNMTLAEVHAEFNWWGDVSGPNDPCGVSETDGAACYDVSTIKNADGLGDAVTEAVHYCPWLITPANGSDYPYPSGDLNFDGCVNWEDFAIFAGLWLEGCE